VRKIRGDLEKKIVSKLEAKILRSLDQIVNINNPAFGFKFRVFSNLPLPQLLKDASGYIRRADSVLGLVDEDHVPSHQVIWPSVHFPLFEWKFIDGKEQAVWCTGGEHTNGRSVFDKMLHSPANTDFWKSPKGRRSDPAAQPFLRAISESKTEQELNAALNRDYPRITTSIAEQRKNKLFMQSIDFVIARDYGHYQPIELTDYNQVGPISPIFAIEFDGITNAFTIDGELKFSEEFGMILDDGSIDHVEQSRRQIKLADKFNILTDINVPAAFLPHHAIEIMTFSNGLKFVKSDIIVNHLNNIHSLLNEAEALGIDTQNKEVVEDFLASNSYFGHRYSALKSQALPGSLKIEKITIDSSEEMYSEEKPPEPTMLGFNEFLKPHMGKGEKILSDVGWSFSSWPGVRISAQYLGKDYSYDMHMWLGFGCNLLSEYDYCMFLGLAANELLVKMQQPQAN